MAYTFKFRKETLFFTGIYLQTLLVGCTIVVFLVPLTMQNPLKPNSVKTVPWASPCTPNGYTNSVNQESSNDIREYLIEKSQESYYHTEYIQSILVSISLIKFFIFCRRGN